MLHLYTVCILVPARSAVHVLRPDRFQPLAVRAARCARLPAPVCASADAWSTVDFFVRRPCVACLACPRVCSLRSPACVRPCSLRSPPVRGLLAPVVRAYIVASPAVLLLAVLLSPPAANFFEIVFKPSISVQLSSAGMGDAS